MSQSVTTAVFGNAQEQTHEAELKGNMPFALNHSYFLNGPARFRPGTRARGHWLDGDGLIREFRICGAQASLRSRYVRTKRFQDESEAERILYRSFGDAFEGDQLRRGLALETPANVSAVPFAGKLLAFGEQSLPLRLDPSTLATVGEEDFQGFFNAVSPLSAHPKLDPHRGRLCNFGIRFLGGKAHLYYYEFDRALTPVVTGKTLMPGPFLIHDFALSSNFACFHLSPYTLDIRRFLKQGLSLIEAMSWRADDAHRLLVLDRRSGTEAALVLLPQTSFILHTINAHESDGYLQLDYLETDSPYYNQYYANPGLFAGIETSRAVRLRLDPTRWTIREHKVLDIGLHMDFPSVAAEKAGHPCRWSWMLGMPAPQPQGPKFYDRILRLDLKGHTFPDSYCCPQGTFLAGEPQFVGCNEAGVVICQQLATHPLRSSYVLFDAFDLARGPCAVFPLPFFDPPAFHSRLQERTSEGERAIP